MVKYEFSENEEELESALANSENPDLFAKGNRKKIKKVKRKKNKLGGSDDSDPNSANGVDYTPIHSVFSLDSSADKGFMDIDIDIVKEDLENDSGNTSPKGSKNKSNLATKSNGHNHTSSSDSEVNERIFKKRKRNHLNEINDQINEATGLDHYSSVYDDDSTIVQVKKEKKDKGSIDSSKYDECPIETKKKKKNRHSTEQLHPENEVLGLTSSFNDSFHDDGSVEIKDESIKNNGNRKKRKKSKVIMEELGEESVTGNNSIVNRSSDIKDKSIRSPKPRSPSLDNKLDFVAPDFKVPELHKILNRVSKPNSQQRALLQVHQLVPKSSKYSKHEDTQIMENWQHFIEVNQLPDKPELFFSLDKRLIGPSDKQKFIYYLARNLPERTPFSVYKRFKLLVMNVKKGPFSQEEDEYILKKIRKRDKYKHWGAVKIAKKLNRCVKSIHKRIEILEHQHSRKIKFKGQNAAAFIRYLLKVTGLPKNGVDHLKDRLITTEEWVKLSKKLDNIPVRILQRAWLCRLHPALFVPDEVDDISDVKFNLIRILSQSDETEWKLISWSELVPHFEGFTRLKLYTLTQQLIRQYVPERKRHSFKKCLKRLLKVEKEDMRKKPIEKIKYENGVVSQRSVTVKIEV